MLSVQIIQIATSQQRLFRWSHTQDAPQVHESKKCTNQITLSFILFYFSFPFSSFFLFSILEMVSMSLQMALNLLGRPDV